MNKKFVYQVGNDKKVIELWWQLYVTWLPVRDLENFTPLDFCWTEGTLDALLASAQERGELLATRFRLFTSEK